MFGKGEEKICPFLRGPCKKHGCELYVQILGTNPQTGKDVSEWGCSFALTPLLTIEVAQQARQTAAAVESMRNEIIKRMDGPHDELEHGGGDLKVLPASRGSG